MRLIAFNLSENLVFVIEKLRRLIVNVFVTSCRLLFFNTLLLFLICYFGYVSFQFVCLMSLSILI